MLHALFHSLIILNHLINIYCTLTQKLGDYCWGIARQGESEKGGKGVKKEREFFALKALKVWCKGIAIKLIAPKDGQGS